MIGERSARLFWEKVDIKSPTDCWEWQNYTEKFGYGTVTINKKTIMAHRVAWELTYGCIPEGQCVLHRCDNPTCVNPSHLFLGTHKDNTQDMFTKGRAHDRRGERHPHSKLTDGKVILIRSLHSLGVSVREIASRMDISPGHVSRIAGGYCWKHLPKAENNSQMDRLDISGMVARFNAELIVGEKRMTYREMAAIVTE